MYEIIFTNQFKKDYKLCENRKYKIELLDNLLIELTEKGSIAFKHNPHILQGNLSGVWEAHIKPDWLLLWEKDSNKKTITLIGTGTHSDLFK